MALTTSVGNDDTSKDYHDKLHNDVNTVVNRHDAELGPNITGSADTLTERLAAMETPRTDPRVLTATLDPPDPIPGAAVLFAQDEGDHISLWVQFPTGDAKWLASEEVVP